MFAAVGRILLIDFFFLFFELGSAGTGILLTEDWDDCSTCCERLVGNSSEETEFVEGVLAWMRVILAGLWD